MYMQKKSGTACNNLYNPSIVEGILGGASGMPDLSHMHNAR